MWNMSKCSTYAVQKVSSHEHQVEQVLQLLIRCEFCNFLKEWEREINALTLLKALRGWYVTYDKKAPLAICSRYAHNHVYVQRIWITGRGISKGPFAIGHSAHLFLVFFLENKVTIWTLTKLCQISQTGPKILFKPSRKSLYVWAPSTVHMHTVL